MELGCIQGLPVPGCWCGGSQRGRATRGGCKGAIFCPGEEEEQKLKARLYCEDGEDEGEGREGEVSGVQVGNQQMGL